MIANDLAFRTTLKRIEFLHGQLSLLRQLETDPYNYHLSASGFLAEVERMELEVRDYFRVHPQEVRGVTISPNHGLPI